MAPTIIKIKKSMARMQNGERKHIKNLSRNVGDTNTAIIRSASKRFTSGAEKNNPTINPTVIHWVNVVWCLPQFPIDSFVIFLSVGSFLSEHVFTLEVCRLSCAHWEQSTQSNRAIDEGGTASAQRLVVGSRAQKINADEA